MEASQHHHECINLSSASSSTAQTSMGQNEYLFRIPISHAEEPETPNFSQLMGCRKFPHVFVPFNYSSGGSIVTFSSLKFSKSLAYKEDIEEEREISHS